MCRRRWFWQEAELKWDEGDWSRKSQKPLTRWFYSGGSRWVCQPAGVEEFDGEGVECCCPWSTINLAPLPSYATSAPELSQKRTPFWYRLDVLDAPCWGMSCEPLLSIANHMNSLRHFAFQREQRAQLFDSAALETPAAYKRSRLADTLKQDLLSQGSGWGRTTNSGRATTAPLSCNWALRIPAHKSARWDEREACLCYMANLRD